MNPWEELGEHLVAVAGGDPLDMEVVRRAVEDLRRRLDFEARAQRDDGGVWADEGVEPGIYFTEEGELHSYMYDPADTIFRSFEVFTGRQPLGDPGRLMPVVRQAEMFSLFEGMVRAAMLERAFVGLTPDGRRMVDREIRAEDPWQAAARHQRLYGALPRAVLTPPPPQDVEEWYFLLMVDDGRTFRGRLWAEEEGWSYSFTQVPAQGPLVEQRRVNFDMALDRLWKAIENAIREEEGNE